MKTRSIFARSKIMKLWAKIFTVIGCGMLLISCQSQPTANKVRAKVSRVLNGQTIEAILSGTDRPQKIRTIGIEAPDLRQSPWGEAAKQKLQKLIQSRDRTIELEINDLQPDRFERIWAHVWHNKTLVSETLVKEGYVLADTNYADKYARRLNYAQEYARLMGMGLWQSDRPMRLTPKEFRSHNYPK